MNVIIGCEFSGVVRSAFRALGHDAWSLDLLEAEDDSPFHIHAKHKGELENVAKSGSWDLGIFHPPCTYLALSGVRWLYGGKGTKKDDARWTLMKESAQFFKELLALPIPKIAVENPIMHRYAREIIGQKYAQIIQPYQFGHGEIKATCLWLKNLQPLKPTNMVDGRTPRVHHASPGANRWKERSRTLPGIAEAMASQWGDEK